MNDDVKKQLDDLKKTVDDLRRTHDFDIRNHIHNGLMATQIEEEGLGDSVIGCIVYAGVITSAGAKGSVFPDGWTVARIGNGNYTVTHNLGTTNYVVMAMVGEAQNRFVTQNGGIGANSFGLLAANFFPTNTDTQLNFLVAVLR